MDERTLDLNFCIVAQPKSGSTWLVHLLSSLIDENYTFDQLEKYIPIIDQKHIPYRTHRPAPDPNLKNIIMLRNPLDATVSWRNYLKLRAKNNQGPRDFSSYYKLGSSEKNLVITYEELLNKSVKMLLVIIEFLGWKNISYQDVYRAIEKCNIQNLRNYEEETLENNQQFLFYDRKAQLKDNIRFYNKAKCYYYKDFLSEKEIKDIYNKYMGAINIYWPEIKEQINV